MSRERPDLVVEQTTGDSTLQLQSLKLSTMLQMTFVKHMNKTWSWGAQPSTFLNAERTQSESTLLLSRMHRLGFSTPWFWQEYSGVPQHNKVFSLHKKSTICSLFASRGP